MREEWNLPGRARPIPQALSGPTCQMGIDRFTASAHGSPMLRVDAGGVESARARLSDPAGSVGANLPISAQIGYSSSYHYQEGLDLCSFVLYHVGMPEGQPHHSCSDFTSQWLSEPMHRPLQERCSAITLTAPGRQLPRSDREGLDLCSFVLYHVGMPEGQPHHSCSDFTSQWLSEPMHRPPEERCTAISLAAPGRRPPRSDHEGLDPCSLAGYSLGMLGGTVDKQQNRL